MPLIGKRVSRSARFKLLMLTGQRKGLGKAMRWASVIFSFDNVNKPLSTRPIGGQGMGT